MIFSQCECTTCRDRCLYVGIRNYTIYMGFMLDDVGGATPLTNNTWYHVAYVYDYSSQTQSVYLQGILDGRKTSAGPYQGQSGSIFIGTSNLASSGYFGRIDDLKIITMAKSSTDILDDATLVAYFSFDGTTLAEDMGPNKLYGSLSNVNVYVGKISRGLSFSGSLSYFQAYGCLYFTLANKPYSFAMWIYPYSVSGGNILQKSRYNTGIIPCNQLIGFSSIGQIVFNVPGGSILVGSSISVNRWTHIGYTYSQTNGLIMYINGVRYATTGASSYSASTGIDWLNVGWGGSGCALAPIVNNYFQGLIDEFYVYRRELTASEIASLANH